MQENVVVVFPLVPVTPTTASSSVGLPKNSSAATAIDARTDSTTSCGTATVERALDDKRDGTLRDASAAKSCPSARRAGDAEEERARATARVS